MTHLTPAVPPARLDWRAIGRSLAPLALASVISAGVVAAGVASSAAHAPTDPTPVTARELYGKWDGTLTVDGRPYCLADWPCYDALTNPRFAG